MPIPCWKCYFPILTPMSICWLVGRSIGWWMSVTITSIAPIGALVYSSSDLWQKIRGVDPFQRLFLALGSFRAREKVTYKNAGHLKCPPGALSQCCTLACRRVGSPSILYYMLTHLYLTAALLSNIITSV